jgi:hypothetical protein
MGFLESVGILAIIGFVFYLFLLYLDSKGHKTVTPANYQRRPVNDNIAANRNEEFANGKIDNIRNWLREKHYDIPEKMEYRSLIKFSSKCQKLILARNADVISGKSAISINDLNKKFQIILKDPLEYWIAVKGYYTHVESERKQEKWIKERNELCIKYNELIFSVFDSNDCLTKQEIVFRLCKLFNNELENAEQIFEIWREHLLIYQKYDFIKQMQIDLYTIDPILEWGEYDSATKITRKDWLSKHKK